MAAITSNAVTGNWSAGSSWVGGVVPGSGDTATIVTGATITVDVNTTIGSSPADQVTMVLTINGPAGKLIIASGVTLTVQGNVAANAGASANIQNGIEWQGTGQFLWPTHNVGTGAAAGWVLKCGQFNRYYARGTSFSSQCGISTAAGSTTNGKLTGTSANFLNCFDAVNMTFLRLGNASNWCMQSQAANVTTSGVLSTSFTGCIFDSVGEIDIIQKFDNGATAGFTFTGNVCRNSLKNSPLSFQFIPIYNSVVPNVITNNVFGDAADATCGVTLNPPGNTTVTGNYFGDTCVHSGVVAGLPDKASTTAFSNNLIRIPPGGGTGANFYSSLDHCYLLNDSEAQNGSILATWNAYGGNRTMDTCIVEVSLSLFANAIGDMIFPILDGVKATITGAANNGSGLIRITATAHTYSTGDVIRIGYVAGTIEAIGKWTITVIDANTFDLQGSTFTNAYVSGGNALRLTTTLTMQNCICVPGGPASAGCKWVSVLDTGFTKPTGCSIVHCTWAASNTTTESAVGVGENNDAHTSGYGWASEIDLFKSNIAWGPDVTKPGYLLVRQQSTMRDYALSANCDYNWGYQLSTDAGTSPIYGYSRQASFLTTPFFSSGSPDAHGCVSNATYRQDPQFVDKTRCMALYDNASTGLNNATATGWATATAYALGDMRSHAVTGYYGGATINYRCTLAHTSGTTTEPGKGSAWRTNWEFATLYRLRQGIQNGTAATPLAMLNWVRGGFSPTNINTQAAGHDGADVGAVPGSYPATVTMALVLGNATVAGTATAASAAASAASAALQLGDATVAGAGTASPAGTTSASMALTLGSVVVAGAGTTAPAPSTSASMAIALGSATVAGVAHAIDPSVVSATMALVLDDATVAGMSFAVVVTTDTLLDIAILARLATDTVLAGLVGSKIYQDHLPETHNVRLQPALVFEVQSQDFEIDLDGSPGTGEATVIFSAFSTRKVMALRIAKHVKDFWLGFQGSMPPFTVDYCAWESWSTTYWTPPDGSDTGPYQVDTVITMGFQDLD